jgi:hypothetical protein
MKIIVNLRFQLILLAQLFQDLEADNFDIVVRYVFLLSFSFL